MRPGILFTLVASGFIFGWCSPQGEAATNERQAEAVVTHLYEQIVLRKPLGIPHEADREAILPFLSDDLIRRFDAAQACESDYYRQHSGNDRKPEFAWLESDLFSGNNEEALPSAAVIQSTARQRDGSFHVQVQLTYSESFKTYGRTPDPANTFKWTVVATVVRDGNRFAVADVLYLNEGSKRIDSRLSHTLSVGCENGKWVGSNK